MKNETGIDWLAFTLPGVCGSLAAISQVAANLFPLLPMDWVDERARNGYRIAAKCLDAGIMAMSGSDRMGTHFIVPGQSIQWLNARGIGARGLFANIGRLDGKATRIDLALDLRGSDVPSVEWFAKRVKAGKAQYASRKFVVMESQAGGYTLYLGNRTSDRFARIYDKKAERMAVNAETVDDLWVRIELELKSERAVLFQNAVALAANIDNMVFGEIADFMDFKSKVWREIIGGETTPITHSTRKLTDTQKWLLETVAPSLARIAAQDPEFMVAFTSAVLDAQERQQSGA